MFVYRSCNLDFNETSGNEIQKALRTRRNNPVSKCDVNWRPLGKKVNSMSNVIFRSKKSMRIFIFTNLFNVGKMGKSTLPAIHRCEKNDILKIALVYKIVSSERF